jgi:hypothetical protein
MLLGARMFVVNKRLLTSLDLVFMSGATFNEALGKCWTRPKMLLGTNTQVGSVWFRLGYVTFCCVTLHYFRLLCVRLG